MSYLPNVILSIANIRHYYPAALALQREGYLKRFICSVGFTNNKFIKYLPKTLEKRASLRYYDEIEPSLIKTIAWAELIPRGLKAAQLMTPERTNWLVDQIYDWVAQVYIDPCEYFHFVVPSGLYSAKKAKKQGSIVIADVRTAHPDHQINIIKQENELWDFKIRNTDLFQIKSKAVFELADYIIVPSEFARYTFLQEGFDEHKIYSIPYGVDHKKFTQSDTSVNYHRDNIFRILYVGRLSPLKGVHYLIQAFEDLNLSNTELILVGQIEDLYRDLITKAVNGNKRIRSLGNIQQSELFRYYQNSSVFVLPTLSEGSALVIYEAMAAGLPVITTPNAGSIVEDGLNGFVIPIQDPQAIKQKLLWFYEHPEKRSDMGKSAYRRSCDFTWASYSQRLIAFYNTIIQN